MIVSNNVARKDRDWRLFSEKLGLPSGLNETAQAWIVHIWKCQFWGLLFSKRPLDFVTRPFTAFKNNRQGYFYPNTGTRANNVNSIQKCPQNRICIINVINCLHWKLKIFGICYYSWKQSHMKEERLGQDIQTPKVQLQKQQIMPRTIDYIFSVIMITDRVRSTTGRLCFDTCLSIHPSIRLSVHT